MSACVFSSDPSREHAQMEQEEAAIFFIRERYFIVYLHSMSLAVVCYGELDLSSTAVSRLRVLLKLTDGVSYCHLLTSTIQAEAKV